MHQNSDMPNFQIEFVDNERFVTDPLVSVVMITYNHERYLAEAIEGVVRQETSFPIELLIGEDCSTDGTREIALSYQKRFPEMIRVITSEQNVGAHENFARVLASARGKYIAFCEGDDFWHRPDKLERQVSALDADPSLSFVCSDCRMVRDDGGLLKEDDFLGYHVSKKLLSYDDLLLTAPVGTATVCARRLLILQAFSELPWDKYRGFLMADLPLWLQLSQYGNVSYDPEPLATYRITENSASRRPDPLWPYRFSMDSHEITYQFLARYALNAGITETRSQQLRIVRRLLRDAAILALPEVTKRQQRRLKEMGVGLRLCDIALRLVPHLPVPMRLKLLQIKKTLNSWCAQFACEIGHRIRSAAVVIKLKRVKDS
jgi:glycosyltransferase involved in cell wall biosynthesis